MQDYSLLKIYSDKIVRYTPIFHKKIDEVKREKCIKNLEKEKLTGVLSQATKSFIRQRLDTWLNSLLMAYSLRVQDKNKALRMPVFVTVTLSSEQKHDDNTIKRHLLNVLIEKLKYHYPVNNLFWRAEAQDNGNIHFHIITDTFIPHKHLQQLWNEIQNTHGYIEPFTKKHGHSNPPSTHIMSVKDVKDFVRYVIKYATKDEGKRPIKGRIWGMSDSLRNFVSLTTDLDSDVWNDLEKLKEKKAIYEVNTDHFSVFYSNLTFTDKRNAPAIYNLLNKYYLKLFSDYYIADEPINKPETAENNEIDYFGKMLDSCFDIPEKPNTSGMINLFDSFFGDQITPFSNINHFH
jgi:hypothetical protein